jgi:hypothetical protein
MVTSTDRWAFKEKRARTSHVAQGVRAVDIVILLLQL